MKITFFIVGLAVTVAACTPSTETEQQPPTDDAAASTTTVTPYEGESFAGTVDAPEFPEGLDWINTSEALTLNALKGKVVLLDFWTYGCINCIHIIPDLERLEAEYPDELVIIGVHSAKFTNEGQTENLKDVVQRYGIAHPVVNDKDFEVWNQWGANAWPTIALIDPASRAVGVRAGEGVYDAVEPVIAALVAEFDALGALNRDHIDFALEAESAPDRPLSYPGKVLAEDGRLWIADTGHNRVLEVDPTTGDVVAAYGSGSRGSEDGSALEASFNAPQGLAVGDGFLFVADTNNHLIRSVDLGSGEVATIAGTGEQGWPPASGPMSQVALSNPWALEFRDGFLYIANAGTHQIWAADLARGVIAPLIGSAREGTANGDFAVAELAQPSGLALSDDGHLYFADSESSSIRVGDLATSTTSLVVGGDANLFEFGDIDGAGNVARLQHPLGTAVGDGVLYVADTYNSKIKRVDIGAGAISSWLGSEPGWSDDVAQFNEPGGLSLDGAFLYVADTNNHAIRRIDTSSGAVTTIILKGVEAFDPPASFSGDVIALAPQSSDAGPATLVLDYTLPEGYKVNEDAPSSVIIQSRGSVVSTGTAVDFDLTGTTLPVEVPIELIEGEGTAVFDVTVIYCTYEESSLCLIDRVRYEVPLSVGSPGISTRIVLARVIDTPGG